jgi:hypothetical protein
VLDADPRPVVRVLGVGRIAGDEDVRRAGLQVLVGEDPVLDGDPGLGREPDPRLHPYPDDHEVALQPAPVGGAHPLDRPVSLERLDPRPISIRTPWSAWMSR